MVLAQPAGAHSIAEFFVIRKFRRMGVGRSAAVALFGMFEGPWEVAQDQGNPHAQRFWHAVVENYANAGFSVEVLDDERWHGPVLSFQARRAVSRASR